VWALYVKIVHLAEGVRLPKGSEKNLYKKPSLDKSVSTAPIFTEAPNKPKL